MTDSTPFDSSTLAPLLDLVTDGIAVVSPASWRLVYVSPALAGWLGKDARMLCGTPLEELLAPESRAEALGLAKLACEGAPTAPAMTAHLQTDDASIGGVDVRFCRIGRPGQSTVGVVFRRKTAVGAHRRDPLTGLPDREFLFLRLAELLHSKRRADRQFAVLFVDLDNFKQVNDRHGHLMGDRVLREVARRLEGCVRDSDDVVRFGGDEFVVLVEGVSGPAFIKPIVDRIQAALARPIALPEGEFTLTLSVGMAQASPEHLSPEDVLHDADRAMYAAKRNS